MTPNPIHRPYHPAAPLSAATEPLYKECVAIQALLPGAQGDERIELIKRRGWLTSEIWRVSRKEKAA